MNANNYIRNIVKLYRMYKQMGDKAIAQVHSDADLNVQLDPVDNSIAVIVKHVGGNLRSRFTEFLTTDGEKPTRDRDSEFETPAPPTRAQVQQWWDEGFAVALGAIESLTDADLDRTVYIRGEAHTVIEALNRSVTHTAYHAGQIVYLARHFTGENWTSLSIPKRK
jgi:hypothetical protein